jgi:hypothetical protein
MLAPCVAYCLLVRTCALKIRSGVCRSSGTHFRVAKTRWKSIVSSALISTLTCLSTICAFFLRMTMSLKWYARSCSLFHDFVICVRMRHFYITLHCHRSLENTAQVACSHPKSSSDLSMFSSPWSNSIKLLAVKCQMMSCVDSWQ